MGSAPRERQGTGAIRGFLLVNRRGLWDESALQLRLDVLNGWFQMVSGYDSRPTPGAATVVSLKGSKELRMGIEKREDLPGCWLYHMPASSEALPVTTSPVCIWWVRI